MNMVKSSYPICKACNQPIYGNYLSALNAHWHPEHFVCAGCGRRISETSFQLHDGAPYHAQCYRDLIAPRCAYCNKPLVGEYLIDSWGTKFCKEHKGKYPECSFCGRLVPPQQLEPDVKRNESIRCPICRASAIDSIAQAQPIFTRLKSWVNRQGLMYNNLPISLELCDRSKLSQYLRGSTEIHSLGVTRRTTYIQNGQEIGTEISGIAVLQGLPATLFQGVTIHELGHVWLTVHGIKDLPLWAEEGFCELLSYRFYSEMNTAEGRFHAGSIERSSHPVYGEGFRRVRAIADAVGFQRLLEVLRTTKRLPSI